MSELQKVETTNTPGSVFGYVLREQYRRKNLLESKKKGRAHIHSSDLWKCPLRAKLEILGVYNDKIKAYAGGELLTYALGLGYEHEIVDMYKRAGLVVGTGEETRVGIFEDRLGGIPDIIVDLGEIRETDFQVPRGTLALVEIKTMDFFLKGKFEKGEAPYFSNELQLLSYMFMYGINNGYLIYFFKGGLMRDNCYREFKYYLTNQQLIEFIHTRVQKFLREWATLEPKVNDQCSKCPFLELHCYNIVNSVKEAVKAAIEAKRKATNEKARERRKTNPKVSSKKFKDEAPTEEITASGPVDKPFFKYI